METDFQKSSWIPVIAVALLGAVLLYSLIYVAWVPKRGVEDQNKVQSNSDETAGWETYTSDEYGFEFKYPAILTLSDTVDVGEVTLREGNEDIFTLSAIYDSEGFSEEDLIIPYPTNPEIHIDVEKNKLIVNEETWSVANIKITEQKDGNQKTAEFTQYDLIKNNSLFILTCSECKSNEKRSEMFKQILSTFKVNDIDDLNIEWVPYINDEYGFEVRYPKTWEANTETIFGQNVVVGFDPKRQSNVTDQILIAVFPKEEEEDFKEIMIYNTELGESSNHPTFDQFEKVNIGGRDFYYMQNYLLEAEYGLVYFAVEKDKVVKIDLIGLVTLGNRTDNNYSSREEPMHSILKKMLSTFKFTN